jgi:hypothetical protein
MKVLAKGIPLILSSRKYLADILIGMYASSHRPSIILVASRPDTLAGELAWEGEPIAIASANAPAEYIQHLSIAHFTMKNYSENEGLWEQLLPLVDEDGFHLFHTTRHAITLGFTTCRIGLLGVLATELFQDLLSEKEHLHV